MERLRENSLGRAPSSFRTPAENASSQARIISDEVLGHLARALSDDAELGLRPMMRVISNGYYGICAGTCVSLAGSSPADWRNRPDDWPVTRYQKRLSPREEIALSNIRTATALTNRD